MSQIKQLLNNLYADKEVVKWRFQETLRRLKLMPERKGFTPRGLGPPK